MLKIRSAVVPSCRSSPLTKVRNVRLCGSKPPLYPQSTGLSASGRRGFYPQIRTVVVFQIVADRVVVTDGVTGHILHGFGFAHLTRRFANHHDQLGFVVHIFDVVRAHRRLVMFGKGVWRFDKYQRLFRRRKCQLAGVIGDSSTPTQITYPSLTAAT